MSTRPRSNHGRRPRGTASVAGYRRPAYPPPSTLIQSAAAPTGRPDHRALLGRLRRTASVGAIVSFGAFFGLATVNVVGVTAHAIGGTGAGTATGGVPAATVAPAVPTLAPGDFFGRAGVPVTGGGNGQAQPPVQPPLLVGGGTPVLTTGGS